MPEIPKWQTAWDAEPVPENVSAEELRDHVKAAIGRQRAVEESGHYEKLVEQCRWTAQNHQAQGHLDEAEKFRNLANQLSAISASNSEQADVLHGRLPKDDGGEG